MHKQRPGNSKTRHHQARPSFQEVAAVFAARVRELRLAQGWTQEIAAERFGVEPAHVRRMEAGTANPTLAVLVSVADAFAMPLAQLLRPRSVEPASGALPPGASGPGPSRT